MRFNNISYNLQIYNKTQIIDLTKIIYPNTDFLQNWKIVCNINLNGRKPSDFLKSSQSSTPTGITGANVAPPIGNAFMYIESSSLIHGENFMYHLREQILFILVISHFIIIDIH